MAFLPLPCFSPHCLYLPAQHSPFRPHPAPRVAEPELRQVCHVSQPVPAQTRGQEQEKKLGLGRGRIQVRVYRRLYGRVKTKVRVQVWLRGAGLGGRLRLAEQKRTAEVAGKDQMSVDELAGRCSCSYTLGLGQLVRSPDRTPGPVVHTQL